MTDFRVTLLHDACTTHDVTADTEDSAIALAFGDCAVSLCHQCSRQLDVADPIRAVVVENLDTGVSNTEADPDPEVVALRARVAELEGGFTAEQLAWARLGPLIDAHHIVLSPPESRVHRNGGPSAGGGPSGYWGGTAFLHGLGQGNRPGSHGKSTALEVLTELAERITTGAPNAAD